MCYQHADADTLFPTIHLTIQSSLPKETVKQIQLQIRNHLKNSATIVFEQEKTDILLSTEEHATGIQINPTLSIKDLEYIRQKILDRIHQQ